MKAALASFFLLIFSLQVLPVKELGKILFKNQLTEERHQACCEDDAGTPEFEIKKENDPFASNVFDEFYTTVVPPNCNNLGLLGPEHLSKQFIPDILTPPPDLG